MSTTEFGVDHGLIHEAVVTGRKVGAGKDFWAALAHNEELFAKVIVFVVAAMRVVFTLLVKVERGMADWTCIEPVAVEEGEFETSLQEFLREDDNGSVGGEEMVKRAEEQGAQAGLLHAEAMLRNQERIPIEWRKYVLVFSEVWQSPFDNRSVWRLRCYGGHWYLDYSSLGHSFDSDYRLVSPRKYQKSLGT